MTLAKAISESVAYFKQKSVVGRLEKVGPKGYIHGWIYVGADGSTDKLDETGFVPDAQSTDKDRAIKDDRADKFVAEHIAQADPSMTERVTALHYVGDGYKPVNSGLRNQGELKGKNLLTQQGLDDTLSKATVTKPFAVFRGVKKVAADKMEPGRVFTDPGYTSTTLRASKAEHFRTGKGVVMEIHVPQGAHAAGMDKALGFHYGEHEVLLPRGSKFHVVSNDGKTVVARLIPS